MLANPISPGYRTLNAETCRRRRGQSSWRFTVRLIPYTGRA